MLIETMTVGPMMANCYIVAGEGASAAAVVDPGADARDILEAVRRLGLTVSVIINTHGHADHIAANGQVRQETGASLMVHRSEAAFLTQPTMNLSSWAGLSLFGPPADRLLEDGEEIRVGTLALTVLHTPGHTPGGICLVVRDDSTNPAGRPDACEGPVIFSGDTLFAGSVGRTDFPGGSFDDLIRSIKEKLLVFDDDTEVYPGHGPATTIGEERASNPFLM
ncbi:MAG TPA: MBL fold metallo-hydrolase [Bacillota bacterium]|jgi:glyoxylase-like metal-dependent hydrolase (beta-lactamase superfamily II)